ncbi:UNVERIFIED_CONTAM: hypothetical protein FKN15_003650 [Acipenser sinensis]
MNTRCPPKRVPSADRFFTRCRLTVQPSQSYSVGGQRSSGQLTGKPAGARPDYRGRWCVSTLERCSKCSQPILDRILRAMGKAYHPHCFTCVVCSRCLDGVPFTVDATSQIHCIEDFHRFSVQVQTAQPVRSYSQTGRPAEQAYAPPSPRQHPEPPYRERAPYPDSGQGWYPAPPLPSEAASSLPDGSNRGYQGFVAAPPGPRPYQPSAGGPKRGQEVVPPAATPQTAGYPRNQGPVNRPEDELDRLTKKLVYDMNHPPTDQYFGRCARCGDNVLGDGTGCIAMDQVFHVECFTCITCQCRLRGQPFYAIEKKSYCENCYIPILDRILRAMGKAYHPHCFTCVVCSRCLDGVPFTVDATSQIHCIEDFHRKFAPRCSVCGKAIMPERGQEETVRIVALDRSFHVNCYMCEDCGSLLSSEGEGRGCYPLDGHILCKGCSARRIQDLSAKISTDC